MMIFLERKLYLTFELAILFFVFKRPVYSLELYGRMQITKNKQKTNKIMLRSGTYFKKAYPRFSSEVSDSTAICL